MTTPADILLDDLEALFGEYGFAEDALYRPEGGQERTVRVIFDEAYQEVDPKSRAPIGSSGPAAYIQASDLPADLDDMGEEDRISIRGCAYRIVAAKPDGHGSVVLRLNRVSA